MPSHSRKQYLEQQALKAAQKAIINSNGKHLDVDDVAKLRIQTAKPLHRILLGVLGLASLVAGTASVNSGPLWLALPLIGLGAALLAIAIVGRKRTVQSTLDAIDIASILEILT